MSWRFNPHTSTQRFGATPTTLLKYASSASIDEVPAEVRSNRLGITCDGTTGLLNGGTITSGQTSLIAADFLL